jgi:hypothetical protein
LNPLWLVSERFSRGRKGSGKSALFRQMPDLVEDAGLDAQVLKSTPDAYAWAALKEYQE